MLHCSSTMDTVPYHPELWETSTITSKMLSLDRSGSGGRSSISSSNYHTMNTSSDMKYLYLYVSFFIGVFITVVCIILMNICMCPVVNDAMSKGIN